MQHRFAPQRRGNLFSRFLELLARQLLRDDQIHLHLAELLIEQVPVRHRYLTDQVQSVVLVHHVEGFEQQRSDGGAEDAIDHLRPFVDADGRVYAAYGGVYIFTALFWLWLVDGIRPGHWDIIGGMVAMLGMAIIMFAPRHS